MIYSVSFLLYVNMSTSDTFDKEKLRFQVNMLLINCISENEVIDLTEMDKSPVLKNVTLNGCVRGKWEVVFTVEG